MSFYYEYQPPSFFSQRWATGQLIVLSDGRTTKLGEDQPVPQWGLYLATTAPNDCGPYTNRSVTLAFQGTVGDAAARVVETQVCTQISLDDLKAAKDNELAGYASTVGESAFEMEGGGGTLYWVVNTPQAQAARSGITEALCLDQANRLDKALQAYRADPGGANAKATAFFDQLNADEDTQAYWRKDPTVEIVRQSDEKRIRYDADRDDWEQLMFASGTFSEQVRRASGRVADDIDAAYDAADWPTLAAIDVRAANYNWPTHNPDLTR